jgi:hypothetical protein
MEKKIISNNGTLIAFEKWGRGPAVLLVNGAMGYRGEALLAARLSADFMGDGSVPVPDRKAVTAQTMILVGSDSPDFKHAATTLLTEVMSVARVKILEGQTTIVSTEILGT